MQKNKKSNYSAFDTAAYYLSFKDRTVKELTDKLKEKNYDESEIALAVSKLLHYGYLDDERYARAYIKDNRSRKGARLIKRELLSKGLDKIVIDLAFESISPDLIDEADAVREIYERRFEKSDIKDEKEKRRIYSYFQRRGFSYEVIGRIIRDFAEE